MATTTHLVRINEVGDCVQQVIDDLNAKLWVMNNRGHFVEMPEEITFQMVVLKEFEAYTSTDMETSKGSELAGGYSTEQGTTNNNSNEKGSDSKSSNSQTIHTEKGTDVDEFYDAT